MCRSGLSLAVSVFCGMLVSQISVAANDDGPEQLAQRFSAAVKQSIPLLETASTESAAQRKCFTCHGQAMPVVTFVAARPHGFSIDAENLKRQVQHTYSHLKRFKKKYADGSGTGGQVDTAGWALWALEAAEREPDEVTDAVVDYLLSKQANSGVWKCSSNRPPSEKSHFATTYLALRGLEFFARESHVEKFEEAKSKAAGWLSSAKPKDTEDRVFQLLTLPYVDQTDRSEALIARLKEIQHENGGWAQLPKGEPDAYATATVLYALAESGLDVKDAHYRRGLEYLLQEQLDDGSWKVTSRSKPFQRYFETGYPHGPDQFISTTAACWATLVLSEALPLAEALPSSKKLPAQSN